MWLGLVTGLGLIVVGLTGSILMFRSEIEGALHPPAAASTGATLGYDDLIAKLRTNHPGHEINAIYTPLQDQRPLGIGLTKLGTSEQPWIEVARTTAAQISSEKVPTFTGWLLELHYSFFAGLWGIIVVGFFGVLLIILSLTGVYLYREFWSQFIRLRWRASARIFLADIHKTVGISSCGFNLILGFTGAVWNLGYWPWPHVQNDPVVKSAPWNTALSIDKLLTEAKTTHPDFNFATPYISMPPLGETIRFRAALKDQMPLRSPTGSWVEFDPQTGAYRGAQPITGQGWWPQFEDMFTALHYGTFGGWPIKILWAVLSLAPGILAVSGFMLWYRRKFTQRPRPA